MTGFGDARRQQGLLAVTVEVRTVNNRYLKVVTKSADDYAPLEGDIERVVRESIGRGTVNVTVRVDRVRSEADYRINGEALRSFWSQLTELAGQLKAAPPHDLGQLLPLPGVVDENWRRNVDVQADWDAIRPVLLDALAKLRVFREDEGRQMENDLRANLGVIRDQLGLVTERAPQVVSEFRQKLLDRVRLALSDSSAAFDESNIIREVSVFSDKADINEEITRLRCHLDQFVAFLAEPASAGRKLDFLTQEMFREVNTIGSKANNVPIAHAVVEMKSAVERIREVLQNVE
jgi:uncharacterized protein (TIGR00255 family)